MDEPLQRWQIIKTFFMQAMDMPPAQRAEFIAHLEVEQAIREELKNLIDCAQATGKSFDSMVAEALIESNQVAEADMVIKQYRIKKLIGQGGMGEVYLAERADKQFQMLVALKLVSSHRPAPELIKRFRDERQILANLEHPNIARLLDGGETSKGSPYLVMEYVDGLPIDEYCDKHLLDTKARITLFMSVCEAVQYAHRNLVVHRDIKTSNILVDKDGKTKLLDFGIAKALSENDLSKTQTALRVLSPLHASPEQVLGKAITVSTDVYSLGVLLYQLLTGVHPISGESATSAALIEKAICDTYPSRPSARLQEMSAIDHIALLRDSTPSELLKQISGDLDNIVMKALNKEPERRYSTVQDLIEDLQNFIDKRPVQARASSSAYRIQKFIQRNRANVAVSSIAILFGVFVAVISYRSILNERDAARSAQLGAETVSGFLQEIFESVDPAVARGQTVTALELLESGKQRITQSLKNDAPIELVMRRILATAYYSLGDTEEATIQVDAAIEIAQRPEINRLSELGQLKLTKGLIAQDKSEFDLAAALLDEAYELITKEFAAPHKYIVEVLHSQAFLQDALSNHEEAIKLYNEALAMNETLPIIEKFEPGWIDTRLSDVLRKEGLYEQGIEILQNAILKMQENYRSIHPKLSIAKRQLAMLYKDTRRFAESESLYLEIIAEQKQLYEEPAQELGITYSEYSVLLSELNKSDEAYEMARLFMDILDQIHAGKPNAGYGAAYNNHGFFLKNLGRYEASVASFKKSIEQQNLIELAPDHFHRSFPLLGLALTYIEMENYAEAEPLLRQVLPMRMQHLDESHLYVTQVKSSLGDTLMRLGKFDEAEKWLNDSLHFYSTYQGQDSNEANIVRGFLEELALLRK